MGDVKIPEKKNSRNEILNIDEKILTSGEDF